MPHTPFFLDPKLAVRSRSLLFTTHPPCLRLTPAYAFCPHARPAQQDRREKESFFNYFYMAINVGSLIACTAIVYVQDQVSWTLGFAIPGMLMLCTKAWVFPACRAAWKTSSAAAPSGALLDGSFDGSAADGCLAWFSKGHFWKDSE